MQPTPTSKLYERQLWNLPTYTASASLPHCSPITLTSNGVLSFAADNVITLTRDVIFQPSCTDATTTTTKVPVSRSPFYASATPQIFVVAAATVLAWVLVIMLVISPRTFMNNLSTGPSPFSVGRGIIGGANGGTPSAVGIGSRPWLQKAAALTVAISLTIATADTFIVSEKHYPAGIDGNSMRALVENSLEIRITRNISDIFVWLAQVQTLIRLFPRHKEKVLIKWIGFALIVLDTAFSCLNSFLVNGYRRPRDFVDAIPALTYLFELALSLLYAAWVIYYAFTKRRYAFYHAKMKTVTFISCLSFVAILTPVVFFVTDITFPDIAGWGDYFRWVGAAAASVIVWEWVERIEILERDEKKDGILGREIFDGDEMLDMNPSEDMTYNARRKDGYFTKGRGGNAGGTSSGGLSHKLCLNLSSRFGRSRTVQGSPPVPRLFRSLSSGLGKGSSDSSKLQYSTEDDFGPGPLPRIFHVTEGPMPPAAAFSPPSRTDTTSAASTVYVVRHDGDSGAQPVRRRLITPDNSRAGPELNPNVDATDGDDAALVVAKSGRGHAAWHGVSNPFKRKRTTPPAEIRAAMRASQDITDEQAVTSGLGFKPGKTSMPRFRSRFAGMASRIGDRSKEKPAAKSTVDDLPWTIIPAQPRGTAWSPPVTEGETRHSSPATDASSRPADERFGDEHSAASSATQTQQQEQTPDIRTQISRSLSAAHDRIATPMVANTRLHSPLPSPPKDEG